VPEGTGSASATQTGTGGASGTQRGVQAGAGRESGTEFVGRAIANELLIIPGNIFSARDTHFRISYAASGETIERGLEVLAGLNR
jgi:aspartate/methionine/tyrosine aminotransferase